MSTFTDGLDLGYRPSSYFWAQERGISLVSDIKGAERRRLYAKALQAGRAELLPQEIFQETLNDGGTLSGSVTRTSTKPLTLQQLVDFFLGSWDLIGCLDCNFEGHGYPRDRVHGFIVDASSSFYADFDGLIRARVDAWLDTKEEVDGDE